MELALPMYNAHPYISKFEQKCIHYSQQNTVNSK